MAANHLWRWRALTLNGEFQQGTIWAPDRTAAMARLSDKQLCPLGLSRSLMQQKWQAQHSYEIFRQLATLLQAGLTLAISLQMLAEQHPVKQWQALLSSLAEDLSEGCAFSEALKKWPDAFPPLYVSMMKTGELTGKLEECCRQLAQQQKLQHQLSAKVKKALRYPMIILILAVVVVLAMVTLVLPEFAAIYKTFNTPLPVLTQLVMGFATFVHEQAVALILTVFLPAIMMRYLKRHPGWQRLYQRFVLRIPIMGSLVRGQKLGQIFTILSLTQRAGIAFLQGLESSQESVEGVYWQEVLKGVRERVAQGAPVWSSLSEAEVFTPLCIQLVRTGEVSGALDTMLANLAHHHNEQTFQHADNLASLLEPLLLIVTGVIIGTLVVAMYLPIFHLGDAMSAG
ncbi:protein transport protein HofC [Lelliottia sp. CFBP8978]|uniref:protein transport protein HofC n=1 Tax=Lelliottia sp. CFBP8978 TaxID=3096522 RepID=UPI002A6AD763|nr:protein transport protein HofC [Lelliottia sp. CFBP8978]MDY1037006.1 protein transport protein HofC [Lelliottia sp. CFBP8978]